MYRNQNIVMSYSSKDERKAMQLKKKLEQAQCNVEILDFSVADKRDIALFLSDDGRYLCRIQDNRMLTLYNIEESQVVYQCPGVTAASFDHNSLSIVTPHSITILDVNTMTTLHTFDNQFNEVKCMALSYENGLLSLYTNDNKYYLMDIVSDKIMQEIECSRYNPITCMRFDHSHTYIACGFQDGDFMLVFLKDYSHKMWHISNEQINAIAFSMDDSFIAFGTWDKEIILWDIKDEKLLDKLMYHHDGVTDLQFSPDHTRLVSSSYDYTLMEFDAHDYHVIRKVDVSTPIVSIAFTENKILGISNSHQLLKLSDEDITFGKQSVFGESNEFEALQEHVLDKADYFIPLISRAYLDSKYTMQELLFGLKKAGQSICKIIPVFVESMDSDEFKKLSGNLMIINHGNDYAGAFDALVDKIKREDELDYWMDLAYQDWNDKHYHSAEISLQKAIELGDKDRIASIYMQLGNIRLDEYSYCNDDPSLDASIDAYRKAVEYADECNDESTLISVMMKLGGILKGYRPEEALRCYERALSIASPFNKKIAVECKKAIDSIKQQQISIQQIDSRLIRISEKMLETIEEVYTLLRDDSSASTVESLRNMYSHLLNYCQVTGISGNIKKQCETRISYLRNLESLGTEGSYSKILRNLIGQSLPDVENMDVFVSFKSQDLELAKKVERFLRNNGKRVFMSESSLPSFSRTEFAKMIDEALEKSKHIVIVATDLSYLTTNWVEYEWRTFSLEVQEGRKTGEILLLLKDDIAYDKPHFPIRLRDREVVKTSELEKKLLSYLW